MRGFLVILALILVLAGVAYLNLDSWIAILCIVAIVWLITLALSRVGDLMRGEDRSIDPRIPRNKNPE